ncbi:MAG: type 1 glutamine amidotransferase domain-containing protein [Desulfobacterales bacterium]|jgi:protease I
MELDGRKIMIFVEKTYNDREFWYPYYRLQEAGAEVLIVAPEAGVTYTGAAGIPVESEAAAEDLNPADFDGLVIPGGYAPDHMRRHPVMVKLVREMAAAGKVVAAICHAGWMLVSADVLRGKTATAFFAIKDDMVNAGAQWVDQDVAVDGKLITSRQPGDLPAFLRAIIQAFKS